MPLLQERLRQLHWRARLRCERRRGAALRFQLERFLSPTLHLRRSSRPLLTTLRRTGCTTLPPPLPESLVEEGLFQGMHTTRPPLTAAATGPARQQHRGAGAEMGRW